MEARQIVEYSDRRLVPIDWSRKRPFGNLQILYKEFGFLDMLTFCVLNTNDNKKYLLEFVGNLIDGQERANNYLRFLNVCRDMEGFPRYIRQFQQADALGIVTTYHGDSLQHVLKLSPKISYANGLRLAYQLFLLLESVHGVGFVHRDVSSTSVRAGLDSDNKFVLQLHRYFHAVPEYPLPSSYAIRRFENQSLQVATMKPYTKLDDYISALYLVMRTQNVKFRGTRSIIQYKQEFDEDPEEYMNDDRLEWIADLYRELCHQRDHGFNKEEIFRLLETAIPDVHPSSPFDYSFEFVVGQGNVVKLDGDVENVAAIRFLHNEVVAPE